MRKYFTYAHAWTCVNIRVYTHLFISCLENAPFNHNLALRTYCNTCMQLLMKNILVELGNLKGRDLVVGLEMVQIPFQGVLDYYVFK